MRLVLGLWGGDAAPVDRPRVGSVARNYKSFKLITPEPVEVDPELAKRCAGVTECKPHENRHRDAAYPVVMCLSTPARVFLLSPAHCGGKRASILFNERARFDLAVRLREPDGSSIGEAFSFLSGLYFRGKLAYSTTFGRPPAGLSGAMAITSNRGLLPVETRITVEDLRAFGGVDIASDDERYRIPLERDARALAERMPADGQAVLLGSVASGKYVDVLLDVFGDRLHFPAEFVGRGDMSRGGLMLRCVEERRELAYIPVRGALRRGARPPKLAPRRTGQVGGPLTTGDVA